MPPLKTGTCSTCSTEKVKLRPNPFTHKEQCEECRDAEIIGVTDIKSKFKFKEDDLEGLTTVSEPQPAFLGGADRRWYLVKEVEERAEEIKAAEPKKTPEEKGETKKKSAGATKDAKRKKDKEEDQDDAEEEVARPAKRGRGRPPKVGGAKKAPVEDDGKPKRGRGRPAKAKKVEE